MKFQMLDSVNINETVTTHRSRLSATQLDYTGSRCDEVEFELFSVNQAIVMEFPVH